MNEGIRDDAFVFYFMTFLHDKTNCDRIFQLKKIVIEI